MPSGKDSIIWVTGLNPGITGICFLGEAGTGWMEHGEPKAMSCTPVWWWEHGSKGHPADASLLPVTSKAWGMVWATEHRCTMEQSQCVILNSDYWVTCNRPQKHLQKRHIALAISISIYQQSSCSNVNPAIELFHLPYPIVWKVPLLYYLNISSLSLKQNY